MDDVDSSQGQSGQAHWLLPPTGSADEDLLKKIIASIVLFSCAWGCGASVPIPTQRMADAESAERSARELGAGTKSSAQLNLKLADDQIAQAKIAVRDGDDERANLELLRATADAELALALAREEDAKASAQGATNASNAAATNTAAANAAANGAQ